ncbi:MAG TPA: Gfo/Idh/MocA family oxidoreductase [Candidatus Limnocylindrales bacterium]|nr:Gfo/Idh/MocA family oxidoreductase [Candidatus Limnocylindrales bacterium]
MKTLIVGAGAICDRWLRVIGEDARLSVCGIVDPNRRAAEQARDRHHLDALCFGTLSDALAASAAQACVNLTPPAEHAKVTRAALEHGLHVLTEKPLATKLSDACSLADLARQRGLKLGVMRNRGNDPHLAAFRTALTEHQVTPPYLITATTAVRIRDAGFRAMTPFPATTDLAIHGFDQVLQLIDARPLQVTSTELLTGFLGPHSSMATITVSFADGSVLSYRCGFASPAMPTNANGHWQVEGAHGAGRWDGADHALIAAETGATTLTFAACEPSYRTNIRSMIDNLVGGPSDLDLSKALSSVALLDAAIASNTAQGFAVQVQEP